MRNAFKIAIVGMMLAGGASRAGQEDDAMDACEGVILQQATNRSSVKFKSPLPRPRVTKMPNGQFVVYTKFRAKNGYGSESVSLARCAIASDATTVLDLATMDSQ